MSWRDAPLHGVTTDLLTWLLPHLASWPPGQAALASEITRAACGLHGAVACALTFPDTRARDLREADRELVRLRVYLEVARNLGLVSPRGHRFAEGMLLDAGRMVGGWRKRVDPGPGFSEEGVDPRLRRRRACQPRRQRLEHDEEAPTVEPQQERPRQVQQEPGPPPRPLAGPEPEAPTHVPRAGPPPAAEPSPAPPDPGPPRW